MKAMKMKRTRPTDRGYVTKIVKEKNKYYDWYKDVSPNWEVVEEFEIEE